MGTDNPWEWKVTIQGDKRNWFCKTFRRKRYMRLLCFGKYKRHDVYVDASNGKQYRGPSILEGVVDEIKRTEQILDNTA